MSEEPDGSEEMQPAEGGWNDRVRDTPKKLIAIRFSFQVYCCTFAV
jgi:hypothetical protein